MEVNPCSDFPFETAMRTNYKNRAMERKRERKQESQRGNDIKSGNEMTERAREGLPKSESPSVDANAILCFTRLDPPGMD